MQLTSLNRRIRASLVGLGAAAVLAAGSAAPAATIDATLIEDTYLEEGAASGTNFSGASTLNFRTHSSVWRNPLIQFALPTLAAGEEVTKAELILQSASNSGITPDIEVVGTTTAIDLSTVTMESAQTDGLHNSGEAGTSALLWTGVWDDFSDDGLIPGGAFTSGQTVTYTGDDTTKGLLDFVRSNIGGSSNVNVTLGLGFVIREGNGGTTSAGWLLHSQEGSGAAPILRLTTAPVVPEPASLGLFGAAALLVAMCRRSNTRHA